MAFHSLTFSPGSISHHLDDMYLNKCVFWELFQHFIKLHRETRDIFHTCIYSFVRYYKRKIRTRATRHFLSRNLDSCVLNTKTTPERNHSGQKSKPSAKEFCKHLFCNMISISQTI